jgi:uncharacterized protein YqjF (DUF2071 family)
LPGEPLFLADWDKALMIHYEVDAVALQEAVPFHLDLREGRAFVSLVAFTLRRMRPRIGGSLAELLFKPISTHEFLNVRTYVRHNGEPGIFFLAEWLSNRLSVALGPKVFGLPYRFGRIRYEHDHANGPFRGLVKDDYGGDFEYRSLPLSISRHSSLVTRPSFRTCPADSLDEWLMERYTAFTCVSARTRRFFGVWHEPWPQIPLEVEVRDQSLLETNWPLFRNARLIGGNFSPGVRGVWMGWPHRL